MREPTLTLPHLEAFVAVLEHGSFGEAGRRLRLSQPAISRRLDALEHDVGVPLVFRKARPARPTAAGAALLRVARGVLREHAEARALAAELSVMDLG